MYGTPKPPFFRLIRYLVPAMLAVTSLCANAQPIPVHFGEDPSVTESKARIERGVALLQTYPMQPGLDVTSMELDITVLPASKSISATAVKHFKISEAVPEVRLQLSGALEIASVRDAFGQNIPYQRSGEHDIILSPLGGYGPGDHTAIIIYDGAPTSSGFGSINFGTHLDEPIVWTLNQPYGAKDWFPTPNDPSDKLDSLTMRITVPAPLVAVSNGLLVSETESGSMKSYTWKHRYPISPYLISMAIANYDEFTLEYESPEGDQIPIANYVWKGQDLNQLRADAQQTIGLMDLFWDLYGPYPFRDERYGHAQFGRSSVGMEHQTISSMGNLGFFLVAHELAHQWFGNKVTNASWSDLWIQEGMASLSEGLPLRYFLSDEDFENWLRVRREQIVSRSDGSVYIPSDEIEAGNLNRMFDTRLTYRKAAWVLNMLRVHVGDDSFFAGLRSYLDEYAYSTASTEDFRHTMETVSGKSLGTFFNQWVYGEGHPELNVTHRPAEGAPGALRIDIRHVGSHGSVPVFEFPLDVRLYSSERDTVVTVQVNDADESFVLEPGFAWTDIEIDPHVNLLYQLQSLTSLGESGPSVPGVFSLEPGYPNPFNPTAIIPIRVEQAGLLVVDVVDVQGRVVQRLLRAEVQPGPQRILWDATGLRSGVYFVRARMGNDMQIVKMTVLR